MKYHRLATAAMAAFLAVQVLPATAQESASMPDMKRLNVGVRGGLSFSRLHLEDTENEGFRTGFHAGVYARWNFTNRFGITGEALVDSKGTDVQYKNNLLSGEAKLRLTYLEFPVAASWMLTRHFSIYGGPYAAFLLKAVAKNESSAEAFDFEEQVDNDNFKSYDLGMMGGVSFEILPFQTGIRYLHGLTKIEAEKDFNGAAYRFSDASNGTIQIYAGLTF